eukprot:1950942-Prymnesium_polylepis.1
MANRDTVSSKQQAAAPRGQTTCRYHDHGIPDTRSGVCASRAGHATPPPCVVQPRECARSARVHAGSTGRVWPPTGATPLSTNLSTCAYAFVVTVCLSVRQH